MANHQTTHQPQTDDRRSVLSVRAALASLDPREQTMARSLNLLALLVDWSRAVFYEVNDRLEKLVTGPIVYALAPWVSIDMLEMIERYHVYHAHHDPFSPRRLAQSDARVVTPRDVTGGDPQWQANYARVTQTTFGVSLLAELTIRDSGRIVAGVSLTRETGGPEVSPGELALLRGAQPLIEYAFVLARRAVAPVAAPAVIADGGLTPRERQIATLIAQGASNLEIAQDLQIATTTVKTHLRHVFAKLGVLNRQHAMLLLAGSPLADPETGGTLARGRDGAVHAREEQRTQG